MAPKFFEMLLSSRTDMGSLAAHVLNSRAGIYTINRLTSGRCWDYLSPRPLSAIQGGINEETDSVALCSCPHRSGSRTASRAGQDPRRRRQGIGQSVFRRDG